MGMNHQFWDGFFAVLFVAWMLGMGWWIWSKDRAAPYWRTLAFWSMVWGLSSGAQLGARGAEFAGVAVITWAFLTLATALLLGVRHLLTRRKRREVAH